MSILPFAPTGTVTEFAPVQPAVKFRFDTVGRVVPDGYTVRYDPDVGLVTVMLSTTADTPDSATRPIRGICSDTVFCAPSAPFGAPTPSRVSRMRVGSFGKKLPADVLRPNSFTAITWNPMALLSAILNSAGCCPSTVGLEYTVTEHVCW